MIRMPKHALANVELDGWFKQQDSNVVVATQSQSQCWNKCVDVLVAETATNDDVVR